LLLADGTKTDYGYGWFIGKLQGSQVIEHGGNMGGFMSHVMYLPAEDILVIVLFNFRGKLPELLASDIAAMAINKPLLIKPVSVLPDQLQPYTGTYKNPKGTLYTIRLEDGKLFLQKNNTPNSWHMIPYAQDKFYFDNTSTIGEMQRDANGKVIRFIMQTRTGLSHNVVEKTD
jgi:hypothetical protein